ncbi:MAG TPA: hypothetical protein VJH03_06575 [Blastocatellia bacterium]|nr:hypothetical protein [Blastocatellia bacterium]
MALAAQVVEALGDIEPKTSEEVAIRDLACDAFDFLYASKETLAENSVTVVFPLMRRAYEDISLLAAFVSNRSLASRWASGGRIKNEDVRKQLETSPLMGPGEVQQIKDMYRHFSSGTHPNRTHLPFSFLGQGNMFTLGAIPPVDALIIGGHLQYLMGLAYWYIGVLGWEFAPTCMSVGGDFTRFVLGLTPRINELMPRLIQQLEAMRNSAGEPPGDIGPRDLIE